VEAVVAVESGFDARAVSPKGARGAMQLMPETGRRYGLKGPGDFDLAERNIEAGVRHLKDLIAAHQGNVALALAAYNAGPRAVARHGQRIPPYPETMLYVPAVLSRAAGQR
jgi:soluble lytic murein transglycosylase-like protein